MKSFEIEKIRDVLNEKKNNEKDANHKILENKIKAFQEKNKILTNECKELT